MSQTNMQKAYQLLIFVMLIGLSVSRPNGAIENQVHISYIHIQKTNQYLFTIFFCAFMFGYRSHRIKISWALRILKNRTPSIGQCNRYNISTMMNQAHQTNINYSIGHFILVIHLVMCGAVVAVAMRISPFGIHTGNWFQSVKHVIDNAISIRFHVSVNKFQPMMIH